MNVEIISKMLRLQDIKEKLIYFLFENDRYISIDQFRNHELLDGDVIDAIYAEYYIRFCNSNNKNRKNLTNFIEDYSLNKDLLHNCFYSNDGMALELISNYGKNFDDKLELLSNLSKNQFNIANNLSIMSSYINFNYVTNLARYKLFEYARKHNHDLSRYQIKFDDMEFDDYNILRRILVSDGYTYMCLNNISNMKIIEDYADDFEALWQILENFGVAITDLFYSSANLFLEMDNYSDVYRFASQKNPKFLDTVKKINPYYILDEIESYHQKKYRK